MSACVSQCGDNNIYVNRGEGLVCGDATANQEINVIDKLTVSLTCGNK